MTEFMKELPQGGGATSGRGDTEIAAFAADLKSNPGQWAKWPKPTKSPYQVGANIKRLYYPQLRTGFEAAVRQKTLYVRFVGGES